MTSSGFANNPVGLMRYQSSRCHSARPYARAQVASKCYTCVRRLRQFLPLGHNAVQHTDHYPQLRQTAQPGHAGIHCHLSCLLLVAWPAGGGHQQVKRIRVTAVGHALADSGCQLLELHDRTLSRQRGGHRRQFDA